MSNTKLTKKMEENKNRYKALQDDIFREPCNRKEERNWTISVEKCAQLQERHAAGDSFTLGLREGDWTLRFWVPWINIILSPLIQGAGPGKSDYHIILVKDMLEKGLCTQVTELVPLDPKKMPGAVWKTQPREVERVEAS
jgi:hypothetical protein